MPDTTGHSMREIALRAKEAARTLRSVDTAKKNAVLRRIASSLRGAAADAVLDANRRDMSAAESMQLTDAVLDRLSLNRDRLEQVAVGLDQVAALPDPVGEIAEERTLDNGLLIQRARAPIGLIAIIYESRPAVTVDAAGLCLKSGNAVILKGGKEAFESNQAMARVIGDALEAEGLPRAAVTLLATTDRQATMELLRLTGIVDLVIPRGGEGLIRFVAENARVPVIQHYKGVCHVYIDAKADLDKAVAIAVNSKTQRPGVCNAMETLLVHEAVAKAVLPRIAEELANKNVIIHADARATSYFEDAKAIEPSDWDREYLALEMNVGVVDGLDAALDHVAAHGSNHTEAIITEDKAAAARWQREVDASLVAVNASTRFNDGFRLGLGAEIGISTMKLHAYGPMGLRELCTLKWLALGQGQIVT